MPEGGRSGPKKRSLEGKMQACGYQLGCRLVVCTVSGEVSNLQPNSSSLVCLSPSKECRCGSETPPPPTSPILPQRKSPNVPQDTGLVNAVRERTSVGG